MIQEEKNSQCKNTGNCLGCFDNEIWKHLSSTPFFLPLSISLCLSLSLSLLLPGPLLQQCAIDLHWRHCVIRYPLETLSFKNSIRLIQLARREGWGLWVFGVGAFGVGGWWVGVDEMCQHVLFEDFYPHSPPWLGLSARPGTSCLSAKQWGGRDTKNEL